MGFSATMGQSSGPDGALRVLLLKPYQQLGNNSVCPPLGLLMLASMLRKELGQRVSIRLLDAKLHRLMPEEMHEVLADADVVALSIINYEAPAAYRIAEIVKAIDPRKLVVFGGPFTNHRAEEILQNRPVDWVFEGEADRTFPEAIRRFLDGAALNGVAGLSFRRGEDVVRPQSNDFIADLDTLPLPAWDMIDFDAYSREPNINGWMMGKRYAPLFTSRGCPYKCNYCHDVFTKRFRWRSAGHVMQEIRLLADVYGIDEFQVVDDIFNLHKPRLKEIFGRIETQYGPGRFHFCFPNGLRADILDRDVIDTLIRGGAYMISIAIETVTPRLQQLIEKHLDLGRALEMIEYIHAQGIYTKGFFMLGFPGETRAEIWGTIRYALRSKLTMAYFFTVVPHPGTALWELAMRESPESLAAMGIVDYHNRRVGWYELATGYPIRAIQRLTYILFYFSPGRFITVMRALGLRRGRSALMQWISMLLPVDLFHLTRRFPARRKSAAAAQVRAAPLPQAAA